MSLSFRQELRQEQKQVLSQRMIQSMEILQLSLQQLEERVETELEDNPLLEVDETRSDDAEHGEGFDETETATPEEARDAEEDRRDALIEHEREIDVRDSGDNSDDFRIADEFASLYADTIDETPARSQNWLEDASDRHGEMIASIPDRPETLAEYLIDQLTWFDLDAPLRAMTERIIYDLDRNGFFTENLETYLGSKRTEEDLRLAREALDIVRRLDPVGVGAAGPRECLLAQIEPDMLFADVLQVIIAEHFDDIQHNRLPLIARKTGFPLETIQEALGALRQLNPRPAAGFLDTAATPVTPDATLEKTEDGRYLVHVEDGRIPPLRINSYYRDLSKQLGTDKSAKDYIRQKTGSAQWLIDAILQRRGTLQKVAQAIVDYQVDFFDIGPEAIKPLKMQQIADIVGIHVTTVSRTCDDKWLLAPQGLFPLRRFFTGAVASTDGEEELAQDAARIKLRELIDKEDKKNPFSDEELVKRLEAEGIRLARRTVVKYRQAMDIPSSRGRRVW